MLRELRTLNDTNIGETIKMLRTDRGLTLNQLAEKTRLSSSIISRYERNKRVPTLSSFMTIMRALEAEMFFAKK